MSKILLIAMLFSLTIDAECPIYNSDDTPILMKHDAFSQMLATQERCPETMELLKNEMIERGFSTKPFMVANRGKNNPALGSFSFFEMVTGNGVATGHWFFGHFSNMHDGVVFLDQRTDERKLLIELIAWDQQKQVFNFYEWQGLGGYARWYYRGDSLDVLADNAYLYRQVPNDKDKYGDRMRCSACHVSGGPIMKELTAPHNDWWSSSRILPLAPNVPNHDVAALLRQLGTSEDFALAVKSGIDTLEESSVYQAAKSRLSLQERLRPLFCETEINLSSDLGTADQSLEFIEIPGEFFVSKFFSSRIMALPMTDYLDLLTQFSMIFPETAFNDADHSWLTPVKGYSDFRAIDSLINDGLIDEDFAAAVLYVDVSHPSFSDQRCHLLRQVPPQISSQWQQQFISNLQDSDSEAGHTLAENLVAHHSRSYYTQQVAQYLDGIERQLKSTSGRTHHFQQLINLRESVFQSEISKNPRGQILEPGFRVIFPQQSY